ncbi:MAG: polysaccharide deacetylase family protein [Aureliella sp.]
MHVKSMGSKNIPDLRTGAAATSLRGLVSIHDVMPETMKQVGELIKLCRNCSIESPMLLIVPGKGWRPDELTQIRRWQEQGCELAGHGWSHHTSTIVSWYHRFHSLLLSRNVAEHLSMSSEQILTLIQRCSRWFPAHDLEPPVLYVPPAWAMGSVTNDSLRSCGFRMLETTSGILIPSIERHHRLPLVGFEADTLARTTFLRRFNQICRQVAQRVGLFRISLHPFDQQLLLKDDLERTLASQDWRPVTYVDYYREQVSNS